MTRAWSLYLDLLRFLAATAVVLFHARPVYKPDWWGVHYGHEAVIVFFVLSGYVIAFVADRKEHELLDYTLSRASRIYSVAIPAIVLTALLDVGGFALEEQVYGAGRRAWDWPGIRILSSLLFTNEIWGISIQLFSNVAYWSLNYEVWYYVGFALLTYIGGFRGWMAFVLLMFLLGPKIVLLMPIWWCGVAIYRSRRLNIVHRGVGWLLFVLSILGFWLYGELEIAPWGWSTLESMMGAAAHRELFQSRQFISDYFLTIIVACHFIGARAIADDIGVLLNPFEIAIRALAGLTFTLYLLHLPLLLFFHALFYQEQMTIVGYFAVLACTFISVVAVSKFTEQKKTTWKHTMRNGLEQLGEWIGSRYGTSRGLVRLGLDHLKLRSGRYRRFDQIDWLETRRLVYVCQGNICRSAFAHHLAVKTLPDIEHASLGIGTLTGIGADPVAARVASSFGVDLQMHRATDLQDFQIQDGDVFFLMEDRHLASVQSAMRKSSCKTQVVLLGLWCTPRFPLIYDPFRLSKEYFRSCFSRIDLALRTLSKEYHKHVADPNLKARPKGQ